MEIFAIEHLSFSYASYDTLALDDFSLSVNKGEFIALCGKSGCGKSTLLRHFKSKLTPHGKRSGRILFKGNPLENVDTRTQSAKIGYVFQSPDNQIVTDKVWHELAFGLESLGTGQQEIRLKVAEMASFFGIESWFHKDVSQLSGGQKQLLNLASIMTLGPDVLILDEPTSQLDPIAASEFLSTIGKINRDLGTTIILSEHRLEEVIPLADKIIVMDSGRILAEGNPKEIGAALGHSSNEMFLAMPVPMRVHAALKSNLPCPVSIREGRVFLDNLAAQGITPREITPKPYVQPKSEPSVELRDIWFKYEKNMPDVIKGLNFKAYSGEISAILGGNGTGKTTALSIISGLRRAYLGNVYIHGRDCANIPDSIKFGGLLGVLPQNPQALFVHKTVAEDLWEVFENKKDEQAQEKIDYVTKLCLLCELLERHPYDLSGGEQQRAALAKVLLLEPEILLLDEPTKGLDAYFKIQFANILHNLKQSGSTIIMVSHDIEFCAAYADKCALFFDGSIVSEGTPAEFFKGNSFYTTAANRMAKEHVPSAITAEDVIKSFGGEPASTTFTVIPPIQKKALPEEPPFTSTNYAEQNPPNQRALSKRTMAAALMILLCIPFTIWFGIYYLGDRKYYFISMLVILETMLPFFMIFEGRKPKARELITISVLCAIGVCGRMAFFWVPQFKPVVAIVIIAGIAFGGETGFLVGSITGFVSNYFFGQGPWTPWQMFAFGIIGFLAGLLFQKGLLRRKKTALCIYGGLSTFIIYGIIANTSTVLIMEAKLSLEAVALACIRGIPFDLIHAFSTVVFLYFLSEPMLEKLDRIKEKYGLVA